MKKTMALSLFLLSPLWATNPPPALYASNVLNLDWIDKNVPLQQDFYTYANGQWQKQHPIPLDRASWSVFSILQEKNLQKILHILQSAAQNPQIKPGSIEQKIGDFYVSGMNEDEINKQGIKPLQPELARIDAIHDLASLTEEIAHLHQIGVDALFEFGSMQDFKDSQQMIAGVMQSGLSLPDRDYYLKDEPKFQKIRAAFVLHMVAMLTLIGEDEKTAIDSANVIMHLETALAEASMSQAAQRDPYAIYHMMERPELLNTTPGFNWSAYFTAMGQSDLQRLNVAMPQFMQKMNQLLHEKPLNDWKIYLRWHLLDTFAAYLSKPFVDENFKMAAVLTGVEKLLPRWKRVVATENSLLGFAIGKIYVEDYFSAAAKQDVLDIMHNIRQALQNDLQILPWMEPATRKAALQKLAHMEERVGYPNKWWDYSSLLIDRGPYVLNVIRANQFLTQRDLKKINKPVDPDEWDMPPQTINAYYSPSKNNINIPCGILQPPFFDPAAPAAANYGAIGFVIGHEITHGFDDQGAKFDAHGNLRDWWTSGDLNRFKAATQCIEQQFSTYTVADHFPVQGKLVVGEATADLGGLTLAYRAFHASKAYKTAQTIGGLTPDQQFFLSAAHVWAMNIRPEQAQNLVTTDPHPPAIFRVNGTLANMPIFQTIFKVPNNSQMVNRKMCKIW